MYSKYCYLFLIITIVSFSCYRTVFAQETVLVTKRKKVSSAKSLKQTIATELAEILKETTTQLQQLGKMQEQIIQKIEELLDNDKNSIFAQMAVSDLQDYLEELKDLRIVTQQISHKQKTKSAVLDYSIKSNEQAVK